MRRFLALLVVLLRAVVAPAPAAPAVLSASWRPGCPVDKADLRVIDVRYLGFDGREHAGTLVVHRDAVAAITRVFAELDAARFPIRQVQPVDAFGGSDERSTAADNTSAFNCRPATGSSSWSQHAYGRAVDINPLENPYVTSSGQVLPPNATAYVDRGDVRTGMITREGPVVAAFTRAGWGWGGDWSTPKDYQHFSATGH